MWFSIFFRLWSALSRFSLHWKIMEMSVASPKAWGLIHKWLHIFALKWCHYLDVTHLKHCFPSSNKTWTNPRVSNIKQNTLMSAKHYKRPHIDIFICIEMAQHLKRSIKSSRLSFCTFKHALWENTTFSQIKHFLTRLLTTLGGKVLYTEQKCPMSPIWCKSLHVNIFICIEITRH